MDNLCLSKIQIYITTRCNLKCKLCGTYCPYLKNPHDLNYDVFKKDVMRLFELVDKFERLELTGGEPILNPYLPDMVDFLRGYGNRVDEIRLLSNGRSLPSDKLLKAIQNIVDDGNRFFVLVDNYGLELSLCIEDAGRLYKNTGAKVELRDYHSERMYMNGWFDYGISPELKRTREQIMQEPKCTNFPLQNRSLFEGTIYTCGRGMYYHTEIAPTPPPPCNFQITSLFMMILKQKNNYVMNCVNSGTANISKRAATVPVDFRKIRAASLLRNSLISPLNKIAHPMK